MQDLIIKVNKIEELQTINDTAALDELFARAKRVLVGGGSIALTRVQPSGEEYKFEEFTTLPDLEEYKKNVFKYLK
ncbi:MAG TPA: hypothetical protein VNS58_11260 [Puia sp.]|nr:hypothetical protein [Puia sp.]